MTYKRKLSDSKKIKTMLKRIEDSKNVISEERDKLRIIFSDLEDILESCDGGIEDIESGIQTIESGIDGLSQYL